MSIAKFRAELAKGLRSPAYLLHAEDSYLLKEALLAAKRAVPEQQRDFMFDVFDMDSPERLPVEQIVDVLYTVPFFGGRKTVALENIQKIDREGIETLARYIAEPSPDSLLILLNSGALRKTLRESLGAVKSIALDIREREVPEWLRQRAAERGLKLKPDAIEYLIGTLGPDAGLLSSEVEKLAVSDKKEFGAGDVREIVRGSGGYDAFDLIKALKAKDAQEVYRIYRVLSETQEPYSLLGALNWHYGRVSGKWKNREEVFAILNEADVMMKSSGGAYPVEYLLLRLLRL